MREALTVFVGAMVAAGVFVVAVIFVVDSCDRNQDYSRIKLPDGQVVECRSVDAYKKACAMIRGCKDGIVRCVASYEVLP